MPWVPVREVEGVESYIVLDRPIHAVGEEAVAHLLFFNRGEAKRLSVRVVDEGGSALFGRELDIAKGLSAEAVHVPVPERPGRHSLRLLVGPAVADEAAYYAVERSRRRRLILAFVWHNHQAPNFLPDGRAHAPWAYVYVYGGHLAPYGRGPYHYHVQMLERHDLYRATFNLSPSLLAQWVRAAREGVRFADGSEIKPGGPEASAIAETLEKYARAAREGRVDVLTSVYAHTILGFLAEYMGAIDIVAEELAYGRRITQEALGGYEPRGAWTPEMAFSMKLVRVYEEAGIEYTVLDCRHHFQRAEGSKRSPHEPYLLVDRATGSKIAVFFRDSELSDALSFKNDFSSEAHAWRSAYEASLSVAAKWLEPGARVLTLALDGENWMVFSKRPPLAAYFFDRLLTYLESLAYHGYVAMEGLRGVLDSVPIRGVLFGVPTASWLGGFAKWRGEVASQEEYWARAARAYSLVRAYEAMAGRDELSRRARWALWHALDSDYWWAEFWSPQVIEAWLREAESAALSGLGGVRVAGIRAGKLVAGARGSVVVEVRNELDKPVRVAVVVAAAGADAAGCPGEVEVGPRSTAAVECWLVPRLAGELEVCAAAASAGVALSVACSRAESSVGLPSE